MDAIKDEGREFLMRKYLVMIIHIAVVALYLILCVLNVPFYYATNARFYPMGEMLLLVGFFLISGASLVIVVSHLILLFMAVSKKKPWVSYLVTALVGFVLPFFTAIGFFLSTAFSVGMSV